MPVKPQPQWDAKELISSMYRDKKTQAGKLRFILPTRLGEVKLFGNVPEAEVMEVLTAR